MNKIKLHHAFLDNIKSIITTAQNNAVRSVNTQRVLMYWNIGKAILEEEQEDKDRADYGSFLIKNLAKEEKEDYGTSFSVRMLELARQFHSTFPIANTLHSQLSWSHDRSR